MVKNRYKVENYCNEWHVVDVITNQYVFTGTLSDCSAWIHLKENGYFIN